MPSRSFRENTLLDSTVIFGLVLLESTVILGVLVLLDLMVILGVIVFQDFMVIFQHFFHRPHQTAQSLVFYQILLYTLYNS